MNLNQNKLFINTKKSIKLSLNYNKQIFRFAADFE